MARKVSCSVNKKRLDSINRRLDKLEPNIEYAKTKSLRKKARQRYDNLFERSMKIYGKIAKCDPEYARARGG